jgi:lysozyme
MRRPVSELSLGDAGLKLIKDFEGFVAYPYDDLVVSGGKYPEWTGGATRGTVTIGYGHTNLSNFPPKIVPGMRMTEAEGSTLLRKVLAAVYEPEVKRLVKVPLTQNEYDALVSFTYNAGGGNLAKSTLLRKLNAGDYEGAAAEFDRWVSSKGQRLNGLIRRRNAEEALFRSIKVGIPAGGGAVVAGKGADEAGYSTGAQIAIGVGIFLVVAFIVVLILRRRS